MTSATPSSSLLRVTTSAASLTSRLGVCHGDAQTGIPNHRQVIQSVAAGDDVLTLQPEPFNQSGNGCALVYAARHDLNEERLAPIDAQPADEAAGKAFLMLLRARRRRGQQHLEQIDVSIGVEIINQNLVEVD